MHPTRTLVRSTALALSVLLLASPLSACASPSTTPAATPTPSAGTGPLTINEVMSANVHTLTDAAGGTPDWIEIRNASARAVDLKGYGLSDSVRKPGKWTFPDVTIPAGGYLVVYATGTDDGSGSPTPGATATPAPGSENELHASFRLGSSGEDLTLTDPGGALLDYIPVPALTQDVSYGRVQEGTTHGFAFFGDATPGRANEGLGASTAEAAVTPSTATVAISEVMSKNTWTLYDENGDSPDWAELVNTGSAPVDLGGFGLSTTLGHPFAWTFPAGVVLPAGGRIVVLLSGKELAYDAATGRIHATFRLGDKDALLRLVDAQGRAVDSVPLEVLPADVSKGRSADASKWVYFPLATPGGPNDTVSFDTLDEVEAAATPALRSVVVSEALALAADGAAVDDAPAGDWIELHNATTEPVDLTGFGLSDDRGQPFLQKLPAATLEPGGYLAVGLTFGLSSTGDRVYVTSALGRTVDVFDTSRLRPGESCGRLGLDAAASGAASGTARALFETPTPGKANTTASYAGYAPAVSFLVDRTGATGTPSTPDDGQLYCTGTVTVALATTDPGAAIHYTLDGSTPTATSPVYDGTPFVLTASGVVRALATAEGRLPGFPSTRTFLFDAPHDMPVVCLSAAPDDFFSTDRGIWTNFYKNWERPMNFTYYETDGTTGTAFDGGVRLNGDTSRKQDQKSMEILLKDAYGQGTVTYPFFPGLGISTFHRLILRTSGQDWKYTHLRDAFMTEVVEGSVDLSYAAVRRVAVYIDGQYWGLYEIREKLDRFYLASHYGVATDNVDLVKGDGIPLEGSRQDYQALLLWARDHDLTVQANYDYLAARLDETSLMDFIIVYSFFTNRDTGNKKVWRQIDPSTPYAYCMYDFDWALFPTTYKQDLLADDLFDPAGHGAYNIFKTYFQTALVKTPAWRDAFIDRYQHFLDTTFATDRMLAIYDENVKAIQSEMPRQIARWPTPFLNTMAKWNYNIKSLRTIVSEKHDRMQTALDDFKARYGYGG